jgi:nitrous oxidase accessory protein
MTGRRVRAVVCAAAVAAAVAVPALPVAAETSHDHPPGHGDLQALLDAAPPGATVRVPAGTYGGPVTITSAVQLLGAPGAVVEGHGEGSVITISAPDVEVAGFVVRGGGRNPVGSPSAVLVTKAGQGAHVRDLRIEDCYLGVTVKSAPDVVIERVRIEGSGIVTGELHAVGSDEHADHGGEPVRLRGDGIWLHDAPRAVVRDNVIVHVRDGIYLSYGVATLIEGNVVIDARYAVHDMYAVDLVVRDNRLRDNLSGMVLMYGGPVDVIGNSILENGSPSTGFGVLVKDVGGVRLERNVIADNRVGVHVDDAGRTGSTPTTLHANTIALNQVGALLAPSADPILTVNGFVENTAQVGIAGSGRTQAVWDVDGVGNYWSDYRGFDADGDGVGDLAYTHTGRVDRLVAGAPMLAAVASGPGFRLLAAVEDRWAPADPLVLDDAPLTSLASPPLSRDGEAGTFPLWAPGALLMLISAWMLRRTRLPKVATRDA